MVFPRWASAQMIIISLLGLAVLMAHPSAAAAPTATEVSRSSSNLALNVCVCVCVSLTSREQDPLPTPPPSHDGVPQNIRGEVREMFVVGEMGRMSPAESSDECVWKHVVWHVEAPPSFASICKPPSHATHQLASKAPNGRQNLP